MEVDPLIRHICETRVKRTNAAPWRTQIEIVAAIVEDIRRAGYEIVPSAASLRVVHPLTGSGK